MDTEHAQSNKLLIHSLQNAHMRSSIMLSIVLSGTFATRPLTVMEERRVDGLSWRHLPIKLKMDQALNVFTEYIMPVVKPSWSKDKVRLLNCNDGLGTINELIGFYQEGSDNTEGSNVVLLRVNGEMTHYMSDRQKEIATMLVLQQLGGNPPLYCEFTNGICYGFAAGNPLSSQDFDNADVIRSVMKSVARLHTIKLPAEYRETSSVIFKYYDKWSELIPLEFKDKVVTDKFNETFGSLCELKKEVDEMKSLLLTFKSPLVFCHNDLQFGNLIYDERTQHTTIIDHEFGGLNYVACELGDIFSEQAGLDCDYSKYPNEEKQKLFIRIYLEESAKLKGQSTIISDNDIHELFCESNKGCLVMDLLWTIWGIVQTHLVGLKSGFDYLEYSRTRYSHYCDSKHQFLLL